MAVFTGGKALFSTRLGEFLPREAVEPRGPIVLRSEPEDDLESVSTRLERDFPNLCKDIALPITNIYEYFDHYDCHVLGTGFLHKVLENIVFRSFTRSQHVQGLLKRWKEGKLASFEKMKATQSPQDVFTKIEIKEYGEDILEEALGVIKRIMNSGSDKEAIEAQHRRQAPFPNISENIAKHQPLAPIPSAQPSANLPAPQSSHISYTVPGASHLPTQRSVSALGRPSYEVPKEGLSPSPRREQFVAGRKNRYSKSIDNKPQVPKQGLPGEIAIQSLQAPPTHTPYYLTPSGIEMPPNTFHTTIYRPPSILHNSMARKPPSMEYSNDVRNLINQPIGATATPMPPIQQVLYAPYQPNPPGAENQYPRDMVGFRSGADFDQTQRLYGRHPAISSFSGNNAYDNGRHLPNDHSLAVALSPYPNGKGRHRRSLSNQAQSTFHQAATANNLGMVSPLVLPVMKQYRHFTTGQLSDQAPWSHEGRISASLDSTTAMSFPEQRQIRQNGPQRNTYQAHGDSRPLDDKTLWVGRFADHVDLEKLRSIFAHCGPIDSITPLRKLKSGGPWSQSFAFIKYENASDAAEAIKSYNGKSLDILGGPRYLSLIVQLAGGPRQDHFSREEGRTQAFSTTKSSPSKQHQRHSGRSYYGGNRRRDSLPSYMAETFRAYSNLDHGHISGNAASARKTSLDEETITASYTETRETPSQIDPGLSQFNISPQGVFVKLPFPGKPEEAAELMAGYEDKSTMTSPPFAAQGGNPPQRANSEQSVKVGSEVVSEEAAKKSEIPSKPRNENKSVDSRSAQTGLKPASKQPYVARAKATTAPLENLSENTAKQKPGETMPVQAEKKRIDAAESQTIAKRPSSKHSQNTPESHDKAQWDGKKPAPSHLGKKSERSSKSKAGEKKEQSKDSTKQTITNISIAGTIEPPAALEPVSRSGSSNEKVAKDKGTNSAKAGSETLAAFTNPIGTKLSKEAVSAEQQDQPISLPLSQAKSSPAEASEGCGRPLAVWTEPTTYAQSEEFEKGELTSQEPTANPTLKWLQLTPSHKPIKPETDPNLDSGISRTSRLDTLATVAEQMQYLHVNETPSVAPKPSTSEISPPGSVPVKQSLALPTELSKDLSHRFIDPETTAIQAQSIITNDGGSEAVIDDFYSASTGKSSDRASGTPIKASTNAENDIASPQLADLARHAGLKHRPVVPARLSSLVTPATPILTHMKKQRNLRSLQVATDNPYSALIPDISDNPDGEKMLPEGKELPQTDLADPGEEGSHDVKLPEQAQADKVGISHARKGALDARYTILETENSAQDQKMPLNEEMAEQSQARAIQESAPSPSTDRVQGHKKTTSKSKKKSKAKGGKGSSSSGSTAVQPGSAAMTPMSNTALPQPETPFVTDDINPLHSAKPTNPLSIEDSSRDPSQENEHPARVTSILDDYYSQKDTKYTPNLHRAMQNSERAANITISKPSGDCARGPCANVETTEDVLATYRRSGYLAPEAPVYHPPNGSPSPAVDLGRALDAFGIYQDGQTSDSDSSTPNSLVAPNDEQNASQVQKSPASTGPFHNQISEVDSEMRTKRNARGLASSVRHKTGSGQLPSEEEILSQLTPEAQKAFLKVQGKTSTSSAGQSSVPVTPTRPQQSTAHMISPQARAMFDQLDPGNRQAAAEATVEFGLKMGSITEKMASFSPAERREVEMLEAQYSGQMLPLNEVRTSLTKSPSREDLHKLAKEMSKLPGVAKAAVTEMIEQRVSPAGSSSRLTSFSRKLSALSATYGPPPTPRPAHQNPPSYTEAISPPPKKSAKPTKRSSNNLPTIAPGTTLEVTQTGSSSSASSMATLTSPFPNPQSPASSFPSQEPYRPARAGSQDPPRYRQGPTGRSGNSRRRRAATQEGPERPFTERMDRDHWGAERHERAHHDEIDPWGVPRGEKAWGVGSSR